MTARSWLIRGGRVVDPATGREGPADVLVRDGRIAAVGPDLDAAGARLFDARDLIVTPGLIDLHVHLREPGFESKETVATGTAAAAAGGFTTICCMPNTRPAVDSVEAVRDLNERVARDGRVRVYPIAAITKGRAGREAVDYAALAEAGAVGFSDDGDTTEDRDLMRGALEASHQLDRPIMVHCEDKALARGAMHAGDISHELGIAGSPAEAEEVIVARDLTLARETGGWLHVCHVSTGRGADLVRRAKSEGVRVTSEVTPHHLLMDDTWVAGNRALINVDEPGGPPAAPADPNTRVNPPLRTAADTRQLLAALADGTLDAVATDHAPHAAPEKQGSDFANAAPGMSGLEFALPLMLALVRAGHLTVADLVRKLSLEPARLLRLPFGTLVRGAPADVTVFDPDETWLVDPGRLATKSANTPLLGMWLRGRVRLTLVQGEERYRA